MQEGLAAGEVVFANTERNRFVEEALDGAEIEEPERRVVGMTGDEAVPAGEVAAGARKLEPELVQVVQGNERDRFRRHHVEIHGLSSASFSSGSPRRLSISRNASGGEKCRALSLTL